MTVELMYFRHGMMIPTRRFYAVERMEKDYYNLIIYPDTKKQCTMQIHKNYVRVKDE